MSAEIARANLRDSLYINGAWVKPADAFAVMSPVDGTEISKVALAGPAEVDAAVKAAAAAWKTWSKTSIAERADWLRKLADEVEKRRDDIASVESLNTGKPFREAQGDVDDAIGCFRFCAAEAEAIPVRYPTKPVSATFPAEYNGSIRYESVGVVAAITPWNFPAMMASWKIGPSLAAGCTLVLKPSEFTPLTALCLADAAHAIGLPAGVFNVVTGAGETGSALSNHPRVDKLTFTGSVPTGSRVMKVAAEGIKRVTLELGGKSPAIVFPDANLDTAVEWLLFGCGFNCGQICSATGRLILHKDIADTVVARMAAAANKLKVGGPFDEGVEVGPIACAMQYKKVLAYIEKTKEEGATVACGGGKPAGLDAKYANGCFVAPTIFTGITPANTIFREEVFGPVFCVTTFTTEEEAIELANNSEYGLGAAVFTGDKATAERVTAELRSGYVWVNNAQPSPHGLPWGGFKKSGIGRELGPFALMPFLEMKSVLEWKDTSAPLGWYPATHFST